MTIVSVQNLVPAESKSQELLGEVETIFDRIRAKAFDLFERRRRGDAVEDWLEAEREFVFSASAELRESETEFQVKLMAPGFVAEQLRVSALPDRIIVRGNAFSEEEKQEGTMHFSEWNRRELLRCIDLPAEIDPNEVRAALDRGILNITAKKSAAKAKNLGEEQEASKTAAA